MFYKVSIVTDLYKSSHFENIILNNEFKIEYLADNLNDVLLLYSEFKYRDTQHKIKSNFGFGWRWIFIEEIGDSSIFLCDVSKKPSTRGWVSGIYEKCIEINRDKKLDNLLNGFK